MRHFLDLELKGHALVFDGPLDLLEQAEKANRIRQYHTPERISWPGRKGYGYKDMVKFLHEPWPEAVMRIRSITERLRNSELPSPKDLRRKPCWDDDQGEIDTDRVMRGDYDYMRLVKRQRTIGPFLVTLVNNLDLTSDSHCNATGVFFRSSLCIALADLLEDLGYMTEIWLWCRGTDVYPKPNHKQFVACCPKKAGDPVDYDSLCDSMSAWFTTEAIFGSFAACPEWPVGFKDPRTGHVAKYGCAIEAAYDKTLLSETNIGKWAKYLDIQEGSLAIPIPMIRGAGVEDGYRVCLKVARDVLARIAENQM